MTQPTYNNRKPLYENEMTRSVGLMATCNCCDRILWEGEDDVEVYVESGGYCKDCLNDPEEFPPLK